MAASSSASFPSAALGEPLSVPVDELLRSLKPFLTAETRQSGWHYNHRTNRCEIKTGGRVEVRICRDESLMGLAGDYLNISVLHGEPNFRCCPILNCGRHLNWQNPRAVFSVYEAPLVTRIFSSEGHQGVHTSMEGRNSFALSLTCCSSERQNWGHKHLRRLWHLRLEGVFRGRRLSADIPIQAVSALRPPRPSTRSAAEGGGAPGAPEPRSNPLSGEGSETEEDLRAKYEALSGSLARLRAQTMSRPHLLSSIGTLQEDLNALLASSSDPRP